MFERVGLDAQNLITILGSQINIIGGPVWAFDEDGNFQFDSEQGIHMSPENYKDSSYSPNLDLLAILY